MREGNHIMMEKAISKLEEYCRIAESLQHDLATRIEQVEKNSAKRFRMMMTTLISVLLALGGLIFYTN